MRLSNAGSLAPVITERTPPLSLQFTRTVRSLNEFAITLTDDSAIAAAATTGDSNRPKKG